MRLRLLQLSIASLLALGAASDALAQSKADHGDSPGNTAVLPIIYSDSGNKVSAYLLLEPTEQSRAGARRRLGGKNARDAALGQIGSAPVCTPVTNAHLVPSLLLEKQHSTKP